MITVLSPGLKSKKPTYKLIFDELETDGLSFFISQLTKK